MKNLISILMTIAMLAVISVGPALAGGPEANAIVQGVNAGVHVEDNRYYEGTKTHEPKRYFAPAGEMSYPGAPGMFGGATPSYMDRLKVEDILEYDEDGITTAEAQNMAKGGDNDVIVSAKYGKVDKEARLPLDATMPVVYEKQAGMKSVGTITVVSDGKKSVAPHVFADIQVKAWELGGTKMHVKAEGFQRLVHTTGAGIGFAWTGAAIAGGEMSAMTGVLGAGKTWGSAGYYDHPFIVVHVLVAK